MNTKAMRSKVKYSVVDDPIARSAISVHAHSPCAERPFRIKRAIIKMLALVGMLTIFSMPANAVAGWRVEGFGDFNGDGKTDVFWHNSTTGVTHAWLMDGDRIAQRVSYDNVPVEKVIIP
jgi:hypothetical protein